MPDNLRHPGEETPFIFERKEQRRQVKAFIDTLPETQREVILLRYYHELKIREIASVTGSNEATVKSRLRQALKKLRKIISGGEGKDETKKVQQTTKH